jgi:hypothetical protein
LTTKKEIRKAAESDLFFFAKLVNPQRVYGDIHKDVFKWWQTCEKKQLDNTALLLPRDHQKSHCAAVKAAWLITRDPSKTILYVSATSALAEKQLKAVKDILTSEVYRRYWPEMIHPEEGKREKWTNGEICVDHPIRQKEGVRDSTVFAAGLTTNITGFHATDVFLDDVVVPNNAYTEEGRGKVESQYSQLASIETTGSTETIVGTRYHPSDLYQQLMDMKEPTFDDEGEIVGEQNVYTFKTEVVEKEGEFLWPKEMRADGKPFGFDVRELARKKAKYLDTTQFYAQYYQEPNDPESHRLGADRFQYYDRKHLAQTGGQWTMKGKPMNVYAAIDFAFSLDKRADYTAIVVVGVDNEGYIYVLDIDRFKTDKIASYYEHVLRLHSQWEFKKLRAEVTVAQAIIANDLKDRIRQEGLKLAIDEHRPTRHQGSKEERIAAALEPRYENQTIYHFKGGYTSMLEEELIMARPAHDDIKDCLASVVEIAKAPKHMRERVKKNNVVFSNRFGGVKGR